MDWIPSTATLTRQSPKRYPQPFEPRPSSKPRCRTRNSTCRRRRLPVISPRIRKLRHSAVLAVRLTRSSPLALCQRHPRVRARSRTATFVPAGSGYGIYSRNGPPCWRTLQPVSVSYLPSHFGKPKFSMVSNTALLIGSPLPLCYARSVLNSHIFIALRVLMTSIPDLTPFV